MKHRPLLAAVVALLSAAGVARAQEQLIDMGDVRPTPFHVSVSSSMLIMRTVTDAVTQSNWDFRASPQFRATFDMAIGGGTNLGLTVGYAAVPGSFSRRTPEYTSANCQIQCDMNTDVWNAALAFHVGDDRGLHQVLEGSIGVMSMGNFRHDTTGEKLGPSSPDIDFAFSIGFGMGYSFSRRIKLTAVQDVGFTMHNGSGSIASPSNTLNPMLMTRIGLRAGIGR